VDRSTVIVGEGSVTTDIRSPAKTRAALLWKASSMLASAVNQYGGLEPSVRKALAAKRFDQALPDQQPTTVNSLARTMLRAKILSRRALMPGSLVRDHWQISVRQRTNSVPWGGPGWHRDFIFRTSALGMPRQPSAPARRAGATRSRSVGGDHGLLRDHGATSRP
jgi:hypothetical protein